MTRKHPFTVSVDVAANAAYIAMTDRPVARTLEFSEGVLVDVDELDVVVGIEVLAVDAVIPFERLVTELHVHAADVKLLRSLQPSISVSLMQSSDGTSYHNSNKGSLIPA